MKNKDVCLRHIERHFKDICQHRLIIYNEVYTLRKNCQSIWVFEIRNQEVSSLFTNRVCMNIKIEAQKKKYKSLGRTSYSSIFEL